MNMVRCSVCGKLHEENLSGVRGSVNGEWKNFCDKCAWVLRDRDGHIYRRFNFRTGILMEYSYRLEAWIESPYQPASSPNLPRPE